MVEELPLALEYGMTLKEFWEEDCDLIYAYQKAYFNRLHNTSHLNGLYNLEAFKIVLNNAFVGDKNKFIDYPKEAIYNPFNSLENKLSENNVMNIDTTKNNNYLYNIKNRIMKERRNNNG